MRVTISNLFTGQVHSIVGNPMVVEEQIRKVFRGVMKHVPHGDLQAVLDTANRMYGFSVAVQESVDYTPPKRLFTHRPASSDPWVREIDTDMPLSSSKA